MKRTRDLDAFVEIMVNVAQMGVSVNILNFKLRCFLLERAI